jgi:hypothetical protein
MPLKIKKIISALYLVALLFLPASNTFAQGVTENGQGQTGSVQKNIVCPAGYGHPAGDDQTCKPLVRAVDCASGKVSQTDPTMCAPLGNDCNGLSADKCLSQSPLTKNLNNIINFLAAGVGLIVIIMIILGGIQYSMAGDNPSAQTEARKRIMNGLMALVAFLLTYSFLQWLIPGGI